MKKKILIVDDSRLMRKMLKDIIETSEEFTVIAEAENGIDAIDKFKMYDPDIVTLDIEMPKMNGLVALHQLLKIKPVPIIIISAYSHAGSKVSVSALEQGAFDLIEKPSGSISLDIVKKKQEIIDKLKAATMVNINTLISKKIHKALETKFGNRKVANRLIAIASSTGGPRALTDIIPKIKSSISAAIAIVQHMPAGFTHSFAERLNDMSSLNVFELTEKRVLYEGDCVIAKGGKHMIFDEKGILHFSDSAPYHSVKPSADIMMMSAIKHFRNNILGIVLTGMGKDGSEGIVLIKQSGGFSIAESKESAIIYGMPKFAVQTGMVDYEIKRDYIPGKIEEILYEMERN